MKRKNKKESGRKSASGKKTDIAPSSPVPQASPSVRHKKSFPVVGIGASAGGLEAFSNLLKHLPVNTGMAFVVVQHLGPRSDGILPSLLAKTTRMPVREVTEGMKVEPNHVYVIPPNTSMAIADGVLKLLPRKLTQGQTRSIDFFFQSLAEARGHEAIGVILSGTASDGTIGLEAIKAEGGITFAQDESAKFDSMPRSAIAAGCVDFVLSPPSIARELARLAQHPYVAEAKPSLDEAEIPPEGDDFKKALTMLKRATGIDFSVYKPATLHRRLNRRLVLGKFKDLDAYLSYLSTHPAELEALAGDFLIGVTNFFRDPAAFEFLKKRVFPKLLKAHQDGRNEDPIRVWVLGCSTGQEAYSLAMTWLEFTGTEHARVGLQIFATDVHNSYLDRARTGVYSKSLLQDVSPERLRRFFVEVDGGYRVSKLIRDMCIFAKQNIITDPPFSHIDLISCRNLLIYLRPELQKKIIPVFHFALKLTGFLFLGPAETVSGFSHLFTTLDPRIKAFAKKPGPPQVDVRFLPTMPPLPKVQREPRLIPPAEPPTQETQREADRLMLVKYAPPGVIVNASLDVVQFRGYTGKFIEPSPGKASLNLLKMAREGLFSPLRSTIKKAASKNEPAKYPGAVVKQNGSSVTVDIEVTPLKHTADEQRCFLVTFHEVPAPPIPPRRKAGKLPPLQDGQLHRELAETKEHLQAVIEQQDAYNEELQSANEEAQAANEELQSINEEMETAKEELQASNEELTTVNEELHARNQQMAVTTNDLTNLLSSVAMPIVMLGRDLCIRRFTPQAEKILSITASDVGQPITDLTLNVPIPDLEPALKQVIDSVTPEQHELQDRQGRWWVLRIRPYMTSDNKIDGAVMMLVDVDELKRNETEITEARDYAQTIIETMSDSLLVLDQTLVVQSANRAFYQTFRLTPQEAEKRYIYTLGNGVWNIPELRKLLEDMLPHNREIHDYEVEQEFPHIGRRTMHLNARRFLMATKNRELILLRIIDVTDARTADKRVRASELRFRRLFESAKDGVLILDAVTRKITDANPFMTELISYSREELLGKELWEIGLLENKEESQAAVRELQKDRIIRYDNLPLRTSGGQSLEVEMVANLYGENGREVIQCNIRDITERQRTAESLRKAQEQLQRQNIELEEQVAARTADLRGAMRELEAFSYSIAHDLRAPLRGMRGFSQELLREHSAQLDEQGKGYLERISSAAARLDVLIQDVLNYTRVLRSSVPLDRVALDRLVWEIVTSYPDWQPPKAEIQIDRPLPAVVAQEGFLTQCISNLVSNAVKFVAPGVQPHVRIWAEEREAEEASCWVRLWIEDNGIGIYPQDQTRIFQMFQRINPASAYEGTGIGLAIVRKSIERMGGNVGVASEPGKGSRFWIELRKSEE